MPIWHHEMRDFYLEPSYDYQAEIYAVRKESGVNEEELLASEETDESFEKLLILFASVTGTAEGYAYRAKKLLRPLQVDVASCESYKPTELWSESVQGGGKVCCLKYSIHGISLVFNLLHDIVSHNIYFFYHNIYFFYQFYLVLCCPIHHKYLWRRFTSSQCRRFLQDIVISSCVCTHRYAICCDGYRKHRLS